MRLTDLKDEVSFLSISFGSSVKVQNNRIREEKFKR